MPQYSGPRWGDGPRGTSAQVTWSFAEYVFPGLSAQYGGYVVFDSAIATAFRDLVRNAFNAWEAVCGIDFVEVSDSESSDIRLGNEVIDGSPGPGQSSTLAICRYWYMNGTFSTAQIYFDIDAYSDGNFYATAVHEIGHAIGLAHSSASPAAVMYPSITSQNMSGALTADDIAGAQTLYGAAAVPALPEPALIASVKLAYQGILRTPLSDGDASLIASDIADGGATLLGYQSAWLDQAKRSSIPALLIDSQVTGAIGTAADVDYFTQAFLDLVADGRALLPPGVSPAVSDAISLQNAYQALAADLAGNGTTGATFRTNYGEHLTGPAGDVGFIREIFQDTFGIDPVFGADPNSAGNQYLRALSVLRDSVYNGSDVLAKGALLGQILYEAVENAPTSRLPSAARTLLLDAADGQVTLGGPLLGLLGASSTGWLSEAHVLMSKGESPELHLVGLAADCDHAWAV